LLIHQHFKSPLFYWLEVARPAGLEPAAPWFEAARSTLSNLARGVANRAKSASWNKSPQTIFSFICRHLLHICTFAAIFRNLPYIFVTPLPPRRFARATHLYSHNSDQTETGVRVALLPDFPEPRVPTVSNLSQCHLLTSRKRHPTLDFTSEDPVLCRPIFVPQHEFLIDDSSDVGQHTRPSI
jgi:hypothetical protein